MDRYLFVFIGGGLGACARYWLSGAVYKWLPDSFPYGNLVVNISACFLIGFLMIAMEDRFMIAPTLRIFLTIGFLGGYSTFSSFSYETMILFQDGEQIRALMNVAASVIGCLGATATGMVVGKLV